MRLYDTAFLPSSAFFCTIYYKTLERGLRTATYAKTVAAAKQDMFPVTNSNCGR